MLSLYWPFIKKICSIAKKVLFVTIVFVTIITVFLYFINRDKPKITQNPEDSIQKTREAIYKVINDPKSNQSKEGKLTISIYRTITCGAIGEGCTNNPHDGDKNYKKSIFGFLNNLLILPYANPPASGVYWAYSGLQNAGFVSKAYAAEGIGFGALKPFMNLWKVFRDVSYMLLVLVLVAIGFMIMFRAKINPQTVISVENALPKIVISLLLITFSFAIAGFLIDLMYIVIALAISVISNNNAYYNAGQFQNRFLNAGFSELAGGMLPAKAGSGVTGGLGLLMSTGNALLSLLGSGFNGIIRTLSGAISFWFVLTQFHTDFKALLDVANGIQGFTFGLGGIPGALLWLLVVPLVSVLGGAVGAFVLPQLILAILILLTIILLIFRVFILLIKAYLQILLMIIFSPLFLLFEALPGRSAFSYWFKTLVAELLTFPIVIVLFLVGYVIVNSLVAPGTNIWTPPFLYGLDPSAFSFILGMGIIFMIPDFVKAAKELLGVKGLPFSFGPGMFFGGVSTAVGGGMGILGQFGSLTLGLGAIGRMMGRTEQGRGLIGGILGQTPEGKALDDARRATRIATEKRKSAELEEK